MLEEQDIKNLIEEASKLQPGQEITRELDYNQFTSVLYYLISVQDSPKLTHKAIIAIAKKTNFSGWALPDEAGPHDFLMPYFNDNQEEYLKLILDPEAGQLSITHLDFHLLNHVLTLCPASANNPKFNEHVQKKMDEMVEQLEANLVYTGFSNGLASVLRLDPMYQSNKPPIPKECEKLAPYLKTTLLNRLMNGKVPARPILQYWSFCALADKPGMQNLYYAFYLVGSSLHREETTLKSMNELNQHHFFLSNHTTKSKDFALKAMSLYLPLTDEKKTQKEKDLYRRQLDLEVEKCLYSKNQKSHQVKENLKRYYPQDQNTDLLYKLSNGHINVVETVLDKMKVKRTDEDLDRLEADFYAARLSKQRDDEYNAFSTKEDHTPSVKTFDLLQSKNAHDSFIKILKLMLQERMLSSFRYSDVFRILNSKLGWEQLVEVLPVEDNRELYHTAIKLALIKDPTNKMKETYKACFEQNYFNRSNATGSLVFFSSSLKLNALNPESARADTRLGRIYSALNKS